jgi:molybdopterin synthase catalytic subunit
MKVKRIKEENEGDQLNGLKLEEKLSMVEKVMKRIEELLNMEILVILCDN